jgi:hypothetical protein
VALGRILRMAVVHSSSFSSIGCCLLTRYCLLARHLSHSPTPRFRHLYQRVGLRFSFPCLIALSRLIVCSWVGWRCVEHLLPIPLQAVRNPNIIWCWPFKPRPRIYHVFTWPSIDHLAATDGDSAEDLTDGVTPQTSLPMLQEMRI